MEKRTEPIPIYEMGSPEPQYFVSEHTKAFNSFSATDIKIRLDDKRMFACQGFSMLKKLVVSPTTGMRSIETTGSMIVLYIFEEGEEFNGSLKPGELVGKTGRLTAVAQTNDSELVTYFDEEVEFIEYGFGISIDDIVCEGNYTFRVIKDDE